MNGRERFLRACRREAADCTPVWFMRQAGRYMEEYRSLRSRHGLMEMFKTPELAAEVTLQPLRAFAVDAAIIFADILLPLDAMGLSLEFVEGHGPVFHNPLRGRGDVESLGNPDPEDDLGYVMRSLAMVRSEIGGRVALIGFAGAPFTLAAYAIEGGSSRDYVRTKKMMHGDRATWELLMSKLSALIADYLLAQARSGAEAVQLFDSWVGCLDPDDYRECVLPHTSRIFQKLREAGVPSLHFGTGSGELLRSMADAGGDVIGVDWRVPLDEAWRRIGVEKGIQGNLDPVALMAPRPVLERKAGNVLARAAGRPGHIFNLGHGILPETPADSVRALADFVHDRSASAGR